MQMRQNLPPLNWLRAFEAAARHLSFTGAARELNMTQSAVSQQIKSLEGHLGRPLFHRRPKALELTSTGQTYLPVVREAFGTLRRGTNAVTGRRTNLLRIQSNITFSIHWLAPRLPAFRAAHPEIDLEIQTELWEPASMAEGVDVEIRYSLRPDEGTRAELLTRDHYYPVCAPGYEVTLDTLADQPLYDCTNMLGSWAGWAEEQSLTWPNPDVTFATTFTFTLAVAQAGGGLTLAHDMIVGRLIRDGRLVVPFHHRALMPEAYYLLQTPQAEANPHAQAFTRWLRAEVTKGA